MPPKRNIEISKPALLNDELDTSQFIKVVVELPNKEKGSGKETPKELYNIDPSLSLEQIIDDICQKFAIAERHKYSLLVGTKVKKYVTDDSLRNSEIQNGNVICLGTAPERLAKFVIQRIEKNHDRAEALEWLQRYSEDVVFNRQFFQKGGISHILGIMEVEEQNSVGCILTMLLACIDDQLIEYREVTEQKPDFTEFLINRIRRTSDHNVLQRAFNLLERGLAESLDILDTCYKLLSEETQIQARLSDKSPETQLATLTFTNMTIHRMEEQELDIDPSLMNKLRQIVLNSIVRQNRCEGDMLTAVTTFQSLVLSINYAAPIKTKGDPSDAAHRELVAKIRKNLELDSWDKLSASFKDEPLAEFSACPPGVLPLKCLAFFSRRYKDLFRTWILNNSGKSENVFPIVAAARHTTLVIADELQILSSASSSALVKDVTLSSTSLGINGGGTTLFELVLILEQSLEELFCQSMISFFATWEEMKAVKSDFERVALVVKEQIQMSLLSTDRMDSLDKFRRNLLLNDYKKILEVRERKHNDEMMEESSHSVKHLKRHLRSEIFQIVREQRLQAIERPFKFHDNPNKKKEFHAKLDKNRRQIWIDEMNNSKDALCDLKQCKSIQIRNIRDIVVGRDCAHLKDNRKRNRALRKNFHSLAFSLQFVDERVPMNFIAENHLEQTWWVDSIKCLLHEEFEPTTEFNDDIDKLLRMKMKVQMIEFQDVEIPDLLPTIEDLSPPPQNWL